MTSPFGKTCPWKGCNGKIRRATGDVDSNSFSVRCEKGHRAKANRKGDKLTFEA